MALVMGLWFCFEVFGPVNTIKVSYPIHTVPGQGPKQLTSTEMLPS